jgi:GH35 family endo-1,4-beta-xylanase
LSPSLFLDPRLWQSHPNLPLVSELPRTCKREEQLTDVDAAFLKLNRNASQQRSRKRQKFDKSKEYKKLSTAEREERLNAIYEEVNRERDIAKARAIAEFAQDEEMTLHQVPHIVAHTTQQVQITMNTSSSTRSPNLPTSQFLSSIPLYRAGPADVC